MPVLLEVPVDSVESARAAAEGGAGRIELCAALSEGGLTPSLGCAAAVKAAVRVPVFAMIRPRAGDFLYSDEEFEIMKRDVEYLKGAGVDGFVFGMLTFDGRIDEERCCELLHLMQPLPVTFHRAFDVLADPFLALERLIVLGFDRVLTSGQDSTALEGLPLLAALVRAAGDRIVVVPGGGVSERNIERIVQGCSPQEIHASCRHTVPSGMAHRNGTVHMGGAVYPVHEYSLSVTSTDRIRSILAIAESL
eukprot:Opistho-2@93992